MTATAGVALVTGSASGIGWGIAQACAIQGMRLVLTDVRAAALAQAAQTLRAQGAEVLDCVLDVSDAVAWEATITAVGKRFGALHLLVNNAGITGSGQPVAQLDEAEWRRILDINLTGTFLGVRHCLPLLRASSGQRHIVSTASMGALLPYAGGASYVATKAAVLAFSEVLRQELCEEGIGVSVLLPAQVRTALFETSAAQLQPDAEGDVMARRAAARLSLERDGLDPLDVGHQVLAAVRARRDHIFTHPALEPEVAARMQAILADMRV